MKIEELLEAARRMTVTEEDVRRVKERLEEFDRRCDEDGYKHRVTQEFLNRTYNL
jgi:tetrahydromethanopterin S-methyltransferase subunit G